MGETTVPVHRYKRDAPTSYALGSTVTIELLLNKPERVRRVLVSSGLRGNGQLSELCGRLGLPVEHNDKAIRTLSPKGNCFVIGEFEKYASCLRQGSHLLLVNPSDAGNLGTIIRTAVGFGVHDIAVIAPGVDHFDPKVIRASMGAVFRVRCEWFANYADYDHRFPATPKYPFMLDASVPLSSLTPPPHFTLIFGNEATGLPPEYAAVGQPIVIPHSDGIDSLSLPIAVGIALYSFTGSSHTRV
jgi:TrmH family RNA methyltransferase